MINNNHNNNNNIKNNIINYKLVYRLNFGYRLFERSAAIFIASSWNLSLYYLLWLVYDYKCPIQAQHAQLMNCQNTYKETIIFRAVFAIITTACCTAVSYVIIKWSYDNSDKVPKLTEIKANIDIEEPLLNDTDDDIISNADSNTDSINQQPIHVQAVPKPIRTFWRLSALALALIPGYVWGSFSSFVSGNTINGTLYTAVIFTVVVIVLTIVTTYVFNNNNNNNNNEHQASNSKLKKTMKFISSDMEVTMAALSLCLSKTYANLLLLFVNRTYSHTLTGVFAYFLVAASFTIIAAVLLTKTSMLIGSRGSKIRRSIEYFYEDVIATFIGLVWNHALMNALLYIFPGKINLTVTFTYAFCISLFTIYVAVWFHELVMNSGGHIKRRTVHLLSISLGSVVGTSYGNAAESVFTDLPKTFGLIIYFFYAISVSILVTMAFWSFSKLIYVQYQRKRRRQLAV